MPPVFPDLVIEPRPSTHTTLGVTMSILRIGLIALLLGYAGITLSAELLNVPQHIWDALSDEQRTLLGERYVVNVLSGSAYGTIVDAQSLNESTPGTTGGSQLGARYGSAAYVDHAFGGKQVNYSATNHVTAQVVGALLGSLADKPGQARFHTRYTIKKGNGGVEYVDEIKADAFRHSVGLCMALGPLRPIDLDTCGQTREQFLAKHSFLVKAAAPVTGQAETIYKTTIKASVVGVPPSLSSSSAPVAAAETVLCKIGVASPVRVSGIVCESAGGSVLP